MHTPFNGSAFVDTASRPASRRRHRVARWVYGVMGSCLCLVFATSAMAAKMSEARMRYQSERAACLRGETHQDRNTCLKEAAAALQESKRGTTPAETPQQYLENKFKRCLYVPDPDREDCQRRMDGEGTTTGSPEDGGIYRELSRTLPIEPTAQ